MQKAGSGAWRGGGGSKSASISVIGGGGGGDEECSIKTSDMAIDNWKGRREVYVFSIRFTVDPFLSFYSYKTRVSTRLGIQLWNWN
mgnify:CR=1 FL=1